MHPTVQKVFLSVRKHFLGKMFNTTTTSNQMSFQIPRLREKCVTRSTPEVFEQCVDFVDVADVIVVA